MSLDGPSPAERRDRLRLARTEAVGSVTYRELMARWRTATRVLEVLPDLARRARRPGPLRIPTIDDAEREIAAGEALGAELIVLGEAGFPPLLAALDPPPPLIWTRGRAPLLFRPAIAIVGARVASAVGQRFARQLAHELGEAGYVVVSGLARGIDGAAHAGSLATGTAAVLAGGIDDIYPPEHAELHAAIADQGCLVSESAPGRRATAKDFPRRNRIISGLSLGVVVVEAEMRSGSLITARLAGEQGREVFAVPGSPLDPRARGTNDLIRQGAVLCEGAEDVLRVVSALPLVRDQGDLFEGAQMDNDAVDAAAARMRDKVEAMLSPTPTSRDEIARALGGPPQGVFAALVELAVAGRAELLPGGMVCRAFPED
ncbi:MAG: DNA protecting protein DprA [Caulobacterales bacterium 32-69-10]|nr:MAG: DNA protecting protein DprA [Caulobacterales bacterium 32-69-10]